MKSIIYKNPVISGILINLFTLFLGVYAIKHNITTLMIMPVPVGILNRKIIDNGIHINNKKKIIILCSFIVISGVLLLYNKYSYNMKINELENM